MKIVGRLDTLRKIAGLYRAKEATKNRFGLLEEDSDSESDEEPAKKDDGEEKFMDRLSMLLTICPDALAMIKNGEDMTYIRELVMEAEEQEAWDKAVAEADGGWLNYEGEEWQFNQEEEEVWSCYDEQEEFKGQEDQINSYDEDDKGVCSMCHPPGLSQQALTDTGLSRQVLKSTDPGLNQQLLKSTNEGEEVIGWIPEQISFGDDGLKAGDNVNRTLC